MYLHYLELCSLGNLRVKLPDLTMNAQHQHKQITLKRSMRAPETSLRSERVLLQRACVKRCCEGHDVLTQVAEARLEKIKRSAQCYNKENAVGFS